NPVSFQPLQSISALSKSTATTGTELSQHFGQYLDSALNKLSTDKAESDKLTTDFLRGESVGVDQMLIAAEKVSLGLEFTVQVRNKMIEAYQEIMRMQM
ncbi:MAG: flagellar hook-basal body complex protein FliE, partial [Gorillibacterium sp.]|nr:flagellar hook-basal body complex protein FliE [Gorillibacterium sp.]